MGRDRRLGWLAVLAGGALALAIQIAAPVGVPLYDGVPTVDPYRYLHPTGTQPGQPTAYAFDEPVIGGASPAFAAATSENPPQAQLIAQTGAFVLTPGATSVHVSIAAVEPPALAPSSGTIVGNVYAFSVTDQAGTALAVAACDSCLSLSMRAPEGTDTATLMQFAGGTWSAMQTVPVSIVSMYQSNPTALGDIAVVVAGTPTASGTPGPDVGGSAIDPVVIFGVGAIVLWLLVFGFVVWQRVRPAPTPAAARGGRKGVPSKQQPSKQRPPRRPGSGSDT
ncbi:MAG TPA: hypothetical protein VE011_10015 [Candidatus Dormibacteraeota bacterium]|nr:hypothetical protein [Candidatus Dormibacteraeota bacterium]